MSYKDPAAVELGRRGGLKGGKARAERMTPQERSESAQKAATARWSTKPIINPTFTAEVRRLRKKGLQWPEIANQTGASINTCQRAFRKAQGPKLGPKQTVILGLIRKHGLVTMEQLRDHSGYSGDIIGRITARLIELGLVERPVRTYYRPTQRHD